MKKIITDSENECNNIINLVSSNIEKMEEILEKKIITNSIIKKIKKQKSNFKKNFLISN